MVELELQALEGAVKVDKSGAPTGVTLVKPLAAGDGVNANDVSFGSTFPYIGLPHSGSGTAATGRASSPHGAMNTGAQIESSSNNSATLAGFGAGIGVLLAGFGSLLVRRDRRRAGKAVSA